MAPSRHYGGMVDPPHYHPQGSKQDQDFVRGPSIDLNRSVSSPLMHYSPMHSPGTPQSLASHTHNGAIIPYEPNNQMMMNRSNTAGQQYSNNSPLPMQLYMGMKAFSDMENTLFGDDDSTNVLPANQVFSMLSSSKPFIQTFPYVYCGLSKGTIDVRNLIHEQGILGARHHLNMKKLLNL